MPNRSKLEHDRPSAVVLAEEKHFPIFKGQPTKDVRQMDTVSKDVDIVDTPPTSSTCRKATTSTCTLDRPTQINTENTFSPTALARAAENLLNGNEPTPKDAELFRAWLEDFDFITLPTTAEPRSLQDAIRGTVEAIRSATTADALRGYRRELVGLLTAWQFAGMGGAV